VKHGRANLRVVSNAEELEELSVWRGISVQTLEAAGIYRDGDWWVIPYPHLTGYWYERKRWAGEDGEWPSHLGKYLSPRKAQPHLYNPLGLGPNTDEVWFAEGEMDTLALIDAGLPAVGYPGVNTIVEYDNDDEGERTVHFRRSWTLLFKHCTVVAAGDMDSAGKAAIRSILKAFRPNSYHFKVEDHDDINDWHKADPEGMLAAIDEFRRQR